MSKVKFNNKVEIIDNKTDDKYINKTKNRLLITSQFEFLIDKLGKGSFGSVMCGISNGKFIAIKCEQNNKDKDVKNVRPLTLLHEFSMCDKIENVKIYVEYLDKNIQICEKLSRQPEVQIYNYLTENNMLSIPNELPMNYLYTTNPIIETYGLMSCDNYDFLTMKLYGKNLEDILSTYHITERGKFFLAKSLLHSLSCVHRCGIIHRDIKLANIVLNEKINDNMDNINNLFPVLIDFGLSKEFFKSVNDNTYFIKPTKSKSITGTMRYISLNIHEFNRPTIIDDLISLTYVLCSLFTNKDLPWKGHLKENNKGIFNRKEHYSKNCSCGFHENYKNNDTRTKNTIAEMKYHVRPQEFMPNQFLIEWTNYLYSLKTTKMPDYTFLYKSLEKEASKYDSLYLELIRIT